MENLIYNQDKEVILSYLNFKHKYLESRSKNINEINKE